MDEMFYSKTATPELYNQAAAGGGMIRSHRAGGGHTNHQIREVATPVLPRPVPTVELCVPICCMKCEKKVREAVLDMDDVAGVICDQSNQKVTVTGNQLLDPLRVLKKVKRIKTRSQFWTRSSSSGTSSNLTYHVVADQMRPDHQTSMSTKLASNKAFYRAAARGRASDHASSTAAAAAGAVPHVDSYTTSYNRLQFMHQQLPSTSLAASFADSSYSVIADDDQPEVETYAMLQQPNHVDHIWNDNNNVSSYRQTAYNNHESIITNPNYLKHVLY
jgi:hypothetical protein